MLSDDLTDDEEKSESYKSFFSITSACLGSDFQRMARWEEEVIVMKTNAMWWNCSANGIAGSNGEFFLKWCKLTGSTAIRDEQIKIIPATIMSMLMDCLAQVQIAQRQKLNRIQLANDNISLKSIILRAALIIEHLHGAREAEIKSATVGGSFAAGRIPQINRGDWLGYLLLKIRNSAAHENDIVFTEEDVFKYISLIIAYLRRESFKGNEVPDCDIKFSSLNDATNRNKDEAFKIIEQHIKIPKLARFNDIYEQLFLGTKNSVGSNVVI